MRFYDERIEKKKGEIARNCFRICFIYAICNIITQITVSLYYSAIYSSNISEYLTHTQKLTLLSSGFIAFGAAVALVAVKCLLKKHSVVKDESFYSHSSKLYLKAAIILFHFLIICYAAQAALALDEGQVTGQINLFLGEYSSLLFVLFAYTCFALKQNDIFLNYSLLDGNDYYKSIGRNSCYVLLYALGMTVITSMVFYFTMSDKFVNASNVTTGVRYIAIMYLLTALAYVLVYVLISVYEKFCYDENTSLNRKATVSTTLALIALYGIPMVFTIVNQISALQNAPLRTSNISHYITVFSSFIMIVLISNFMQQYNLKNRKILVFGSLILIFKKLISTCTSTFISLFTYIPKFLVNVFDSNSSTSLSSNNWNIVVTVIVGFAQLVLIEFAVMCIIEALKRDGIIPNNFRIIFGISNILYIATCVAGTLLSDIAIDYSIELQLVFILVSEILYLVLLIQFLAIIWYSCIKINKQETQKEYKPNESTSNEIQ